MIKDALIAAAGRGARLDRSGTPKPLVDVDGEPMLFRIIRQLESAGIERAFVVVGHRGKQIARALHARRPFRLHIETIKNPHWKQGLAGSVACARTHLRGPFLLAMSDHVFDDALVRLMVEQQPPPDGVTILVDPKLDRIDLESAVTVRRDAELVVDIGRNLPAADAVDAGLFVASEALFEALDESRRTESSELCDGIHVLAQRQKVRAVSAGGGGWDDVDFPRDLARTEKRLRAQKRTGGLVVAEVAPTNARRVVPGLRSKQSGERVVADTRTAVVTSAGTGIGRAIADTLLDSGYVVVGIGRRRDVLERTAQFFGARGRLGDTLRWPRRALRGIERRMESRLTDLEVRYAYLERAVSDLDKVALELRGEIERLRREFSTVRELVLAPAEPSPPNEKPPHY